MLDYKLIEALYYVINDKGFEKAASRLCITQSAISQRVKLLEEQVGQVLLQRLNPPQATHAGKAYINHYLKVKNLENDLNYIKNNEQEIIKLGINADSLATWFIPQTQKLLNKNTLLDLTVDDQDHTINLLKSGHVVGCISTMDKNIPGCNKDYIGTMKYRMLSSKSFKNRWFKDGFNSKNIINAPAVIFNHLDELHNDSLKEIFTILGDYPKNYIPSSEQLYNFILNNQAYGMVPDLQSKYPNIRKDLIELNPPYSKDIKLYLHYWNNTSESIKNFFSDLKSSLKSKNAIY